MGDDGCEEASDGVGEDGSGGEFAVVHRVEHGGVCAQESAPAHADGGEDADGVAIDPSLLDELGHQSEGSADGTQRGDGEADEVRVVEAEEPLEDKTDLLAEPGQYSHALIGGTGVGAIGTGREGEDHDQRGDNDDAGDDGQAHVDARASAIEQRVEDAQKHRLVLLVLDLEVGGGEFAGGLVGILGVCLLDEVLHQARGDDAAADGSHQSDEGLLEVAVAHHKDDDNQSHTEGRAKVGEGDELVLLEVGGEALILGEGDDSRVVAQEGEHGAKRSHTGQVEQGLHERAQDLLEQVHHAKLDEETADGTGDDADGHQEEAGVEQEVVGGVHDGVEHVGGSHGDGQASEQGYNDRQTNDAAEAMARTLEGAEVTPRE